MANSSLKRQLSQRERPTTSYRLHIRDMAAAQRQLAKTTALLRQAVLAADRFPQAHAEAVENHAEAEKALDACYATLQLRALPPAEYEALIDAHPPTGTQVQAAEDAGEPSPEWNRDTLAPALLAACVEGDVTEADWVDFLKTQVSKGEATELFVTALAVNESARLPESVMLPKGLPPTGIWL